MTKNKRSTLSRDISYMVEALDNISGAHFQALDTLSDMANDQKLSVNDRNKARLAMKLLGNIDPHKYNNVLSVICSMSKSKSIKNLAIENDDITNDIVNEALKVDKHKDSVNYELTDAESKRIEKGFKYSHDDVKEDLQGFVFSMLV